MTDAANPDTNPDTTDLPTLNRLYRHLLASGQPEFAAEVNEAFREIRGLREEVERVRGERDQALAMFSKFTHRGPLNMPRDFHLSRGRRMAGLPVEGIASEEHPS